ncbi:MAG: hypothetical protein IMF10_02800 [Proteobacteria bacterium]|nr:hypothetical protein [Pseudomonadota bacterium]
MEIKMPLKIHGNYQVAIRLGDWETRVRCQRLLVKELSPEQRKKYYGDLDESEVPTHQVSFHDFGCRRNIEGKIKENTEDKLVVDVKGKEYEFSPFVPSR